MDLDGVIADVRPRLVHLQRRPKDWAAFFAGIPDDAALEPGIRLAGELARRYQLVYLSGRPEHTRGVTESWLVRHRLPAAPLYLRSDGDRRPARLVKPDIIRTLARCAPVAVVVDDDPAVVRACQAAGWPVLAADWGRPDVTGKDYLEQAQEGLGRT